MNQVEAHETLFALIDRVRELETKVVEAPFGQKSEPRAELEKANKDLREAWKAIEY